MGEWKTIEPKVWKPEQEDDSVQGVLISKEPKTDDKGAKYHFENENGAFLLWGSAILDDRMQFVHPGDEVCITYKGQTTNKIGHKVNLYKVQVKKKDSDDKKDSGDVEVESAKESVPEETVQ